MSGSGKRMKVFKVAIMTILAIAIVSCAGFYIYTLDYYKAAINEESYIVTEENFLTILKPQESNGTGLIFYPGGKVEATAYLPLLKQLTDEGITCVLVKMPLNLAVFGVNRADTALESPLLADIEEWYIGGHSLGGAMASSYAEKNIDKFAGLILLASYSVHTMDIPMIAIYGSEDSVLNRDKLTEIPRLVKIEGGNHAYFGNYGEQQGDGAATITREDQQEQCIQEIMEFIGQKSD